MVLDTIEALFSGLSNTAILRAELRRLFRWLKDKGVTAIITGERGEGSLTRYGLEEYVADCVILLDHRVDEQMATRRLRIVKYRGSTHGTNEYPFLIDESGISILPITSLGLKHEAGTERVSTGIAAPGRDAGRARATIAAAACWCPARRARARRSLAAHFARRRLPRAASACLWFAFEESPSQIIRNMRSIGIDLEPAVRHGTAALPRGPPHALRPGDAPGDHAQAGRRQFKPRVVDHRPDHQLHQRSAVRRRSRRC